MKSRRSLRSILAILALFGVLFAQLGIAAYACPLMTGGEDCCISVDPADPALCSAHCQQGDQSLDKPGSPLVAPAALLQALAPAAPAQARPPPGVSRSLLSRRTAPSAAVRLCRLLI